MKKYMNVDIIETLDQMMRSNTTHYQSDFLVDIGIIKRAANASRPHEKWPLWMSRNNGTHCLLEKEVFVKDSSEYNTWQYWKDTHPKDKFVAFAIKVDCFKEKAVMGNLYELDYIKHADLVKDFAMPFVLQIAHYEYVDEILKPDDQINYFATPETGEYLGREYIVTDICKLEDYIDGFHTRYENLPCGDISKRIDEANRKPSVRDKLKSEKDSIAEKPRNLIKVVGVTKEIEV